MPLALAATDLASETQAVPAVALCQWHVVVGYLQAPGGDCADLKVPHRLQFQVQRDLYVVVSTTLLVATGTVLVYYCRQQAVQPALAKPGKGALGLIIVVQ